MEQMCLKAASLACRLVKAPYILVPYWQNSIKTCLGTTQAQYHHIMFYVLCIGLLANPAKGIFAFYTMFRATQHVEYMNENTKKLSQQTITF